MNWIHARGKFHLAQHGSHHACIKSWLLEAGLCGVEIAIARSDISAPLTKVSGALLYLQNSISRLRAAFSYPHTKPRTRGAFSFSGADMKEAYFDPALQKHLERRALIHKWQHRRDLIKKYRVLIASSAVSFAGVAALLFWKFSPLF